MTNQDKAEFITAYIDCALWSSTDDNDEPLDGLYGRDDIAAESEPEIAQDCNNFLESFSQDIDKAINQFDYSYSQAGYDFWLTRNGHGAGFWDRGLGELGEYLTTMAKLFGEASLYVGDDNYIHYYA